MNIKEASEKSGLTQKSIRYYESIGLLQVSRMENGYRQFQEEQVKRLKEIHLLRNMDIRIEDIKQYYENSLSLDEFLGQQLVKNKKKMEELQQIQKEFLQLQKHCEEEAFSLSSFYEEKKAKNSLRTEYQEIEYAYLGKTKQGKNIVLILIIWGLVAFFLGNLDGSYLFTAETLLLLETALLLSLAIYWNKIHPYNFLMFLIYLVYCFESIPEQLEQKLLQGISNFYLRKLLTLLLTCVCLGVGLGFLCLVLWIISLLMNL